MKDTIFLLVKVEIQHNYVGVHKAITELQEKSICFIADTEEVTVIKTEIMDYKLNGEK